MWKKITSSLIVSTLLISNVALANVQEVQDTTKPVITELKESSIFASMPYEEQVKEILGNIQAIDDVDGDISSSLVLISYQDLTVPGIATVTVEVKDRAGNRQVKLVTVRIYERQPNYTGLTSQQLVQGESLDLLQNVQAVDDNGNLLSVKVTNLKKIVVNKNQFISQAPLTMNANHTVSAGKAVDSEKGFYEITYEAADFNGKKYIGYRYISTTVNMQEPVIADVHLNKTTIKPGEKVQVEVDAIGVPQSAVINVFYDLDSNYKSLGTALHYNEKANKFIGTMTIPAGYDNNIWTLSTVGVNEANGKTTYLRKKDNAHFNYSFMIYNGIDAQPPVLTVPNTAQTIKRNETFNAMEGVHAYDIPDGDLTSKIVVTGEVNTTKSGNYDLIYTVTDQAGLKTTVTRTITVYDEVKPTLDVKETQLRGYLQQGEQYLRNLIVDNATAYDNEDGDLTNQIDIAIEGDLKTAGVKKITYKVKDRSNNETTKEVNLFVENYPQDYYILGVDHTIILKNEPFDALKNVSGQDVFGNELEVKVTGEVDVHKEGQYELVYEFTNAVGEIIRRERLVEVKALMMPYFVGEKELSASLGDDISIFKDLEAYDMHGKWLSMIGRGSYNLNKLGTYTIEVSATDRYNQTIHLTRTVIVKNNALDAFIDVPISHPFYVEINDMKKRNIINGYPGGKFGPNDAILRKHVAALIYRSGIDLTPIREAKNFIDVPKSDETYTAIEALYRAGIIDGNGDKFFPNDTLKREELAKILVAAFKLENKGGYDQFFSDVNPKHWSYPYVTTLASHEITVGAYGKFMPKDIVSRQHYATFMYRALKN